MYKKKCLNMLKNKKVKTMKALLFNPASHFPFVENPIILLMLSSELKIILLRRP